MHPSPPPRGGWKAAIVCDSESISCATLRGRASSPSGAVACPPIALSPVAGLRSRAPFEPESLDRWRPRQPRQKAD